MHREIYVYTWCACMLHGCMSRPCEEISSNQYMSLNSSRRQASMHTPCALCRQARTCASRHHSPRNTGQASALHALEASTDHESCHRALQTITDHCCSYELLELIKVSDKTRCDLMSSLIRYMSSSMPIRMADKTRCARHLKRVGPFVCMLLIRQ